MTYKLPMNDDGMVDFELLESEWAVCLSLTDIFKSIASHYEARGAEMEREACIDDARSILNPVKNDATNIIVEHLINTIHARVATEIEPSDLEPEFTPEFAQDAANLCIRALSGAEGEKP